jgi:predicted amidohydrolase YtcJ
VYERARRTGAVGVACALLLATGCADENPGDGEAGRAGGSGAYAPARAPIGTLSAEEDGCLILTGAVRALAGATRDEAIALRRSRVEAVGTRDEVEAKCGPESLTLDLGDASVLPAAADHHVHLLNTGFSILNALEGERMFLDLSGITSLDEFSRRLSERAEQTPPGEWILGKGWDQGALGLSELPDRAPLDAAVSAHPVFLTRTDGHAGWMNGPGLDAAGITAATRDPPGGVIVRRSDGEPSGVLLERANEPVVERLPGVADDDVLSAFRLAAEALAARGVTEAFDAGFLAAPGVVALNLDLAHTLDLLVRADLDDPLPIRIHLMVPAPSGLAESVLARPEEYDWLPPRVGVSHLKLFADGALGSRGGALTHPYADDPETYGVPRMTVAEIHSWSRRAVDAGLGVAVHAIGDEAVRRTLDAFGALLGERPDLDPHRLRIEHFSYFREEDSARALRLGPVLSIQPNFNSPLDAKPSFAALRVGEANEDRVYAWRRLHAEGAVLVGGSDYFALPGPALLNFHAAFTTRNGLGSSGPGPEGRIDALRLESRRVHAEGGESWSGTLQSGGPGDLAILSGDPLTAPIPELLAIRAIATFRDGEMVYHDGTIGALRAVEPRARIP